MLRRFMIRVQFVGVDDHIDPRSAETNLGAPLGELSAKTTEGFAKSLIIIKLTPPTSAQSSEATSLVGEAREFSSSKATLFDLTSKMEQ